MAKGQKKSNREIRKPKQAKAKVQPAARSFLSTAEQGKGMSASAAKRTRG